MSRSPFEHHSFPPDVTVRVNLFEVGRLNWLMVEWSNCQYGLAGRHSL